MPLAEYRANRPNYGAQTSSGLEALSGAVRDIQDRKEKDLERRDTEASRQALVDPLLDRGLRKLFNGEMDGEQAAIEYLIQKHIESQPSLTRQPSPGPFAAGYDNGPDAGPMIPYSEPPPAGRRLNLTRQNSESPAAMLDLSSLNVGRDPGIQNRDVDQLTKLGGMLSNERRNDALADYRSGQLGLGYDKLAAQRDRDALLQDYRQASADYMRAKAANLPEQMELARVRAQTALGNLNMRGQELGLGERKFNMQENVAFEKMGGAAAEGLPMFDNLLMKATSGPGRLIPNSDYVMRRASEILGTVTASKGGLSGSVDLGRVLNRVGDVNLSQEARDFRRQVRLALSPYRKMAVGSQITQGEMDLINELSGEQLSMEDTIAGLSALRQLMSNRLRRAKAAFPGAASRIPEMPADIALPPLMQEGATLHDPYGLGALNGVSPMEQFETGAYGYQPYSRGQ